MLLRCVYPENKMWYFVVKQSMQFLEPGKYDLALSRILHSSDRSIFLLFWSHIKLDNSVAFCLFPYLKEFLCLYSHIKSYIIFYIVIQSYILYISLFLRDLSCLYDVVHPPSLLIDIYFCCI